MQDRIRAFVLAALAEMQYDVEGVTGDTDLGPAGLDLESLALADLSVQVEDEFGVKFDLDEMETTALMTLDQFTADVEARITAATATSGSPA
ncbi:MULTISPECIES: acyl carrier protein [Streptomycetaceae]|uniref:Acyl carrier protein n=1 Tax=Kitasatospora purpeofusca TaxID=67352 RepID=A0ABZ1TW85_9ACTN|nr:MULTISPECIES: acyl carrier protein [Streptomycetaceae]KJY31010.1 phosphopantetheine-binding-protein [Streptomyces sp. NRRL S-495]KOV35026.1 phosphopantetheine-binding-protein [Streptomyces sp. XY431]WTA50001.1 acyl carrier protein [Kitasatospora purpeofusca]SDS99447.1 acyl carrier protein [Streptomyces sp. TLI_053]